MFESSGLDAQCAHGDYREIVCKPTDVVWDFIKFNNKDQDI